MNKVDILETVKITNKRIKPFKGKRRYLATGNLSNQGIDDFLFVDYENKPSRADLIVSNGDLILARMKATNKVFLIDYDSEDLVVSTGFLTLKPKDGFDGGYLYHYFRSKTFQRLKDKYCSGATQKAINNSSFKNLKVPRYEIAQQKKIVQILDKADNLRQKRKEQLALLDDYLKSVFLEMFGDPIMNQMKWKTSSLKEITNLITDGKHGDCRNDENSGYYFISAKDIHDGIIDYSQARQILKEDFEEVHRRTSLAVGDLVMVNTGATIGKMAIVNDDIRTGNTTFQKSVAIIKPKINKLTSIYLKYVFILRIHAFAGISSGSAQKNLLLSQMRNFKIPLPQIELQIQLASIVEQVEKTKQKMRGSLDKMDNHFNALIQRYFE